MTGSEVLTILLQAAQAAVAGYLGKKAKSGVETLLAWIDDRVAAQPSLKMSGVARKNIEKLLAENPTLFERILANVVRSKDRQGIMLVGPTGAGKTHLAAAITQTVRQQDYLSTVEITATSSLFNGRLVVLRDTPGKVEHGAELWKALEKYQPSILVLVMSYGYLAPAGTGVELRLGLRHPLRRKIDRFLQDGRKEEITVIRQFTDLVREPKSKVKHLVVVANKMDMWLGRHAQVVDYYQTNTEFQNALRDLLDKVVRPGQTAQVVTAAAEYDSFKGVPPDGQFSQEAATDSVRVLKALLAALLRDGNLS
ncbi:MAG TPA: ATP-binding protein [Gemmataceae bacterium]|nr:ATP-binding protein [Gemmataceae bacterium]